MSAKKEDIEVLDERIKQMEEDIKLNTLAVNKLIKTNRKLLSKKRTLMIKRKTYNDNTI